MAVWFIGFERGDVVLRYWSGESWQECGRAPRALQRDVLGWCAKQAAVFDVVVTPAGSFVRQAAPPEEPQQ